MRNLFYSFVCLFVIFSIAGCGQEVTTACKECGKTAKVDKQNLCEECASYVSANSNEKDSAGEKHYVGWGRSFEEGKAQAQRENKSMLVLFTGSDWCPPCKSLHEKVFTSSEFQSRVPENVVLVVCDKPRDKSLVSDAEIKQYAELSPKFKVSGVPSLFLTDASGKPYHKMVGYGGTPADEWVSDLMGKVESHSGK